MSSARSISPDWESARALCLKETRRLLRDRHAAEDAAQEALLRAFAAQDQCRNGAAFRGWLRVIAGNEARRLAERGSRLAAREQVSDDEPDEPVTDVFDEKLSLIACEQILAVLSAADRELMRLRYVSGLTQRQIAGSLGLPEGTVKIRLHRSRKKLHNLLSNEAMG
jgi:RNA polymerase sigma-70 factor (ECF subfamily)